MLPLKLTYTLLMALALLRHLLPIYSAPRPPEG